MHKFIYRNYIYDFYSPNNGTKIQKYKPEMTQAAKMSV